MTDPGGRPLVLGVVAPSGTGKTTLLCHIVPALRQRGLRVGAIKHAHDDVELDQPGKDSHRLREAGASAVMLVSVRRWALFVEHDVDDGLSLDEAVRRLGAERLDLVLVEGYRGTRYPKIELYRQAVGETPCFASDPSVIAVATSDPLPAPTSLPVLPLDRPDEVARFIEAWVRAERPASAERSRALRMD